MIDLYEDITPVKKIFFTIKIWTMTMLSMSLKLT